MNQLEKVAKEVALLLDAEIELTQNGCLVKKKRLLEIRSSQKNFSCVLELDISFRNFKKDGVAVNKAEILLLPEELAAFTAAWSSYGIPLPVNFKQRCEKNPNIVCMHLETTESPRDFAARLSAALSALEPMESIS